MHMSHQYMCFLLWAVPFQTDLEVVNLQPRIIPLLPGAVIIKCKSAHRQPSVSHDTSPFTDNQGSAAERDQASVGVPVAVPVALACVPTVVPDRVPAYMLEARRRLPLRPPERSN
eukprot:CAMPEP_0174371912 /NCGR_PEP_ID=MMETSP0811_2-20130205/101514_1 /TAXON_ID=73025 ORGANISM="Eutreptiella gymnastica-like, Strain CCMP1594" /NCGR_SAMPLE_ID=MMETSP0811_2 /ASSEMBLY_ACC=CAM_ASM_000667 /LENGTH=114 /DNA_ID=CAMNT_0015518765 /DNA_START=775 /DNA_END=1119 /DNA_ORIENTATION=+